MLDNLTAEERALSNIKTRHVYCDELSEKKTNGKIKRKYKLAGYWAEGLRETGYRLFFISTSKDYIPETDVIKITKNDYERIDRRFRVTLGGDKTSHYSLKESELLSGEEIQQKMVDEKNGFLDAATITEEAFCRFSEKTNDIKLEPDQEDNWLRNLVETVTDKDNSEEKLKEIGLL